MKIYLTLASDPDDGCGTATCGVPPRCPCSIGRSMYDDPEWRERLSPFDLAVKWAASHARLVWARQYRGTLVPPDEHRAWLSMIGADERGSRWVWDDREPKPRRPLHPGRLWIVWRKPEPWGHFAVARLNGEKRVIDGSLPAVLDRIPRDAVLLDPEQMYRAWHEDNESHVFGGPNIAKALRAAVKATNEGVPG